MPTHFNYRNSDEKTGQKFSQPVGYRKMVTESSVSNRNLYCSDHNVLDDMTSQHKSLNIDTNTPSQGSMYMNQSAHNNKNLSGQL